MENTTKERPPKVNVWISKQTGGAYANVREVIQSELHRIRQAGERPQHSPLPWKPGLIPEDGQRRAQHEAPRSGDRYFISPLKGSDVCEIHHSYETDPYTSKANAELIISAVNNAPAVEGLVEALNDMIDLWVRSQPVLGNGRRNVEHDSQVIAARKALAPFSKQEDKT